jgi:ABC-type branched-subunit amino acid transport system substrate-binding protein
VAACASAVLLGYGLYFALGDTWGTYAHTFQRCADGIWERGPEDECVGVSDGSYAFGDLGEVSRLIEQENEKVAGGSVPYVTIALLIPMTTDETDPNRQAAVRAQIRHEVQGAYLAQLHMNEGGGDAGAPAVRLVLANPGRDSRYHEEVSKELARMTGSRDALRAVVGFDMSEENTKKAITHLTEDLGIPVVGGPITSSDLTMPGLARVVPPNEDQANVLASLVGDDALLVEDTRPGDTYVATLRDAFNRNRPKNAPESEQYRSLGGSDDDPTLAGDFENIAQNICQAAAKDIYFAGRPPQLRMLVEALGSRSCAATGSRFRVVTGSGASTVDSYVDKDRLDEWRHALSRVTVEYAAVGHPDAWTRTKAPEAEDSRAEVRALEEAAARQLRLGKDELDDSRLMTIYDATRLAVKNIRHQAEGGADGTRVPRLDEVFSGWQQLRSANKVLGTTGWICLDNQGNAYNKAVALVRLDPAWDGDDKLRFDHVAWPTASPLTATCTARRQD